MKNRDVKQPIDEPRRISKHAWYYVENSFVDLCNENDHTTGVTTTRLSRRVLEAMLAELKPKAEGR